MPHFHIPSKHPPAPPPTACGWCGTTKGVYWQVRRGSQRVGACRLHRAAAVQVETLFTEQEHRRHVAINNAKGAKLVRAAAGFGTSKVRVVVK